MEYPFVSQEYLDEALRLDGTKIGEDCKEVTLEETDRYVTYSRNPINDQWFVSRITYKRKPSLVKPPYIL
jgi:hypothetical protein